MIGRKNEPVIKPSSGGPVDMKAVLGKGSEFEGKLRFEGTVRIDGKFKGEIISEGVLVIGDNALIDGELSVESAIVSGEVRGNITAKGKIELRAPGKVFGNITAPVVVVEEGVLFDGYCKMTKEGAKPGGALKPIESEKKDIK